MDRTDELEKQSLLAASEKKWPQAIEANLALIKLQPKNISALNRLAWAYLETGKKTLAKLTYKKVLCLDPYNLIANKNLIKIDAFHQKISPSGSIKEISSFFLEEPGKTKVVSLNRVAAPETLANLHCAQEIQLASRKKSICIRSQQDEYLGVLPDDLAFRLKKLLAYGNQYRAWIKGIEKNGLQIFIRETVHSPKIPNYVSFPPTKKDYVPVPFPTSASPDSSSFSLAEEE